MSDKLDVEEFRDLTKGTADLLRVTNDFPKSIELFEKVLKATPAPRSGIEIGKIITLQEALAVAYYEGGFAQKSVDLNLITLEIHTRVLGPDHKYTLETKASVGSKLLVLGRQDETRKMLREVLQGYENNGDTQDADYLETKFILAINSSDEEEKNVALELMTEKLKEQEKDPNSNSGFIKGIQLGIALMLGHKGHLEEASHVCLKQIEDATERFGPSGLTTLKFKHAYALVLYEQGKYDPAARLLLELLETYKTQLIGSDHRFTLEIKALLGRVYLATKELDKAEALLDVEVTEKVFSPEHPETLKAASFLSDVKEEQGKFRDALALQKKVLEVRKKVLEPNYKDTLSTMLTIGTLHYKMEDYKKATEVAQEILERHEEALGKDHPIAITSITSQFLTLCMERLVSQNNLTMTFTAFTSVGAETGKFLLKASNWNFQTAVDTYRNLNLSQILTETQVKKNLIRIFMAITEVSAETGKSSLQASEWQLQDALEAFFESRLDEDIADLDVQDDAVSAVSCNETEVNQIQDAVAQVESIAELNQRTTSILFILAGGTWFRGQFGVSSTIKNLYKFVTKKRPHLADFHYVLTLYPNIQLTKMEQTLEEANIPKNVALTLKMLKQ